MLAVNGHKAHTGKIEPKQTGVYCFVNNKEKLIFANVTDDIKKGYERHKQKLDSNHHRESKFLDSYNHGDISFSFFPTKDWDEAQKVLMKLNDETGYEVVRL